MYVNGTLINAGTEEIIYELREQLQLNGIPLLSKIKRSGNDIMVSCPYHKGGQETRPSAGIRVKDGMFHCLACGETHSITELISFCFGHENDYTGWKGYEWILKNFATTEVENRKMMKLDLQRTSTYKQQEFVTEEELDTYRYTHPYMYKRGLTDNVIDLFDIGYDKSCNCITFPVRDVNGNCLFVARRSTMTKYFNYPSGAEKPIYGLYELTTLPQYPTDVVICESMLDALKLWTVGKYAIALNGLGSSTQYKQLNSMPCRKFILCTDMDNAGLSARTTLANNIHHKLIMEYILPEGRKDANDCTYDELYNLKEHMYIPRGC